MNLRLITRFFRIRPALAGLLAVLLAGCHSMSLNSGNPFFNSTPFAANPPRTLAILPTTDNSGHPDLAVLMRQKLFTAISPLPYQERDLHQVDALLASKAARQGIAPDLQDPGALLDPKLADCVIYTQLDRVSRLYLLLYAHYRFDLNLAMVDTRSRQVLYRNHFVFYDRLGTPAYVSLPMLSIYALAGVAESGVESLWHLRSGRLDETFEEGAKEIAKALPLPDMLGMSTSGTVRLTGVQVVKPYPALGNGERVIVKAQGTRDCHASFSLGRIARDLPMTENAPGSYLGMYTVKPGDNADYVIVEVSLAASKGGEQILYAADKDSFAIDTTPPARARVADVNPRFFRAGVFLNLELNPAEAAKLKSEKLEFQVYRKLAGEKQYRRIGVSRKPLLQDPELRVGQEAAYYVVTRDEAGNLSPVWDIKRVKLE